MNVSNKSWEQVKVEGNYWEQIKETRYLSGEKSVSGASSAYDLRSDDYSDSGAATRTLNIDGRDYGVLEGDILVPKSELGGGLSPSTRGEAALTYSEVEKTSLSPGDPSGSQSYLIGISNGQGIVRWAPGAVLTYAVLRQTFPDASSYRHVVEAMRQATDEWMDTCGVEFEHKQQLDSSNTLTPQVMFPVRGFDAGGQFIAAAFFPDDPVSRRKVLIDPSFFTTRFDKTGVLRHELGHVLGFRHEHIRSGAPAVCPDESSSNTFPLSDYDPQSVMHYFCGGVGTRDLRITEVDRAGSQLVYGAPFSQFQLIEP
jgi:Matrixin